MKLTSLLEQAKPLLLVTIGPKVCLQVQPNSHKHSLTSYSILVYQRFHEINVWTFKRFKENMYWDTYRTVDGFLFGLLKSKLRLFIPMIWKNKNWECNCTSCTQASNTSVIQYILLAFYYKYCTYRCLTPNFFDCTELINVKPIFFTIFLIFHEIEIFFGGFYSTYNWKLRKKFPSRTYDRRVRIIEC